MCWGETCPLGSGVRIDGLLYRSDFIEDLRLWKQAVESPLRRLLLAEGCTGLVRVWVPHSKVVSRRLFVPQKPGFVCRRLCPSSVQGVLDGPMMLLRPIYKSSHKPKNYYIS